MENVLKQSNLKNTKARENILEIIKNAKLPISAEEIYKTCLVGDTNVNLSTIYRTLNTMVGNEILIKQVRQDGVAYYQENKHDHKHLLICTKCGKKITLDICPLEQVLKNIASQTKFTITSHNIEVYGLCEKCSKIK